MALLEVGLPSDTVQKDAVRGIWSRSTSTLPREPQNGVGAEWGLGERLTAAARLLSVTRRGIVVVEQAAQVILRVG
jgi:hypothetical protein